MVTNPVSAGLITAGDASMKTLMNRMTGSDKPGEADSAGQKFEVLFASQLVKEMTKMMPEGGFMAAMGAGGGPGSDIYETMIQNAMADEIARKGTGMGGAFARMTEKRATNASLSQNNNANIQDSVARDTVHVNNVTHSLAIDGKIRKISSGTY